MTSNIRHIVIQWPRFGPYHVARIAGLYKTVAPQGVRVTAMETASGMDNRYAWTSAAAPHEVQYIDVLPGKVLESVPAGTVFRATYDALNQLQPDAVGINAYSQADAWACLTWCRDNRRVAVLMNESKADDAPRKAWRERCKGALIRQFDCGINSGQAHRDYMAHLGLPAETQSLGYSVVDNAFFVCTTDQARHQGIQVEIPSPFFLCVSQFIPRKNVDGLIRSYSEYRHRMGSMAWPLVILGDGPQRASIEALISQLAVEDVHPLGLRSPEVLPHYYANAGALVHPAHRDQWGLVVNEAMAAGLPIIASTGSGSTMELVFEGINGFRMTAGNDRHLTDLLARMSAPDTDLERMGAQSRRIVADWSPTRFGTAFWDALQQGISRADRRMPLQLRALIMNLVRVTPQVSRFHTVD